MGNENKLDFIDISKKVEKLVFDKKIDEAQNLIKPAISYIEQLDNHENTSISYTFDSAIEFIAYTIYFKNDKNDTKWLSEIYSRIYTQYGYILIEKNELDLAFNMLKNALKWNPMCIGAYYELASIALKRKDFTKFYDYTLKAGKKCLTFKGIGKYFRNLGYYYIEKEEYKLALCLYYISLIYDENNYAYSEIDYLKEILKDNFIKPEYKECFDYAKQKDVDILPNIKLLGKLYGFADNQKINNKTNLVLLRDIYQIVYDFVLDEEIPPKIEEINNLINNKGNNVQSIQTQILEIEEVKEELKVDEKIKIESNENNNIDDIVIEIKDENKKENNNIEIVIEDKGYTTKQAANILLDRLKIENKLMLSSALEIITLIINILLTRKEKNNITIFDFKKTLNVLMMNTYKTFTSNYNEMPNEVLVELEKYYNMNEEVQTEVIGNILFGLRKVKDEEKIF